MSTISLYISGAAIVTTGLGLARAVASTNTDAKELRTVWKWAALSAFMMSTCWFLAELDVRDHQLLEQSCVDTQPSK